MKALLLLAALTVSGSCWAQQGAIPNPARTPGAINSYITQAVIRETLCIPHWTRTIRPPPSYTHDLKVRQMRELRLPGTIHDYHEDHLVPLCVGGHPGDPRNLWLEPIAGKWPASVKDQLELSVCRAVCLGTMTLRDGAVFLTGDWTKAYEEFFKRQ